MDTGGQRYFSWWLVLCYGISLSLRFFPLSIILIYNHSTMYMCIKSHYTLYFYICLNWIFLLNCLFGSFLVMLRSMWIVSSLARDQTCDPCSGSGVLTTGLLEKALYILNIYNYICQSFLNKVFVCSFKVNDPSKDPALYQDWHRSEDPDRHLNKWQELSWEGVPLSHRSAWQVVSAPDAGRQVGVMGRGAQEGTQGVWRGGHRIVWPAVVSWGPTFSQEAEILILMLMILF